MNPPFDPLDDEVWYGGFYEAAIVLGDARDADADERLAQAMHTVWAQPALRAFSIGGRKRWNWSEQQRIEAGQCTPETDVYGVFDVAGVGRLPVSTLVVRETDGDDWLYVGVPLGGVAVSGGYPFGEPEDLELSRQWRAPLEEALARIALAVGEIAPFRIAGIGFEIAGIINTQPEQAVRYIGLVAPGGDGFRYWPTTKWS